MSQPKKRKKKNHGKKPLLSYVEISKHYYDDYVRVVRKILTMAGIDPVEFDVLTKRTKKQLMLIRFTSYRILAEKDTKVPRSYIQFFNYVMNTFEKQSFFGDPQYNVSYLEYLTYGLSFIFAVRNHDDDEDIISEDQHNQLEKIKVQLLNYLDESSADHYLVRTSGLMRYLLMQVSMPNYRYYTGIDSGELDFLKGRFINQIKVSSFETEKRYFRIRGEKHKSYQLWHYNILSDVADPNPEKTEIPAILFEENDFNVALEKMKTAETIIKLPVFIQSHALHRLRQRIDCMGNMYINKILSLSFLIPKIITAKNGQKLICAIDATGETIGYFPFLQEVDAVLILSFLPLSSPITPEGSVLYKELGIKIDDSKYLGLDKLSFFLNTDFDTLPTLKMALQKANMWHLTEIVPPNPSERKDDLILKRFFAANRNNVEISARYSL